MRQVGVDFENATHVAEYDARQGSDRAAERQLIDPVRAALLPDFWKQVALLRVSRALKPGGIPYLRDVVFSFEPHSYEAAIDAWVGRMPGASGFSRDDFETHVREEYSTFSRVLEGLIARADLEITEKVYASAEYAEYVCTPAPGRRLAGAPDARSSAEHGVCALLVRAAPHAEG